MRFPPKVSRPVSCSFPAGVRLLSTLLFGGAGALGLLIVSWMVSFFYFFPSDFMRAFAGGIVHVGWSIFDGFIAILQAYIFMMLTVVYISMAHEHH